MPVPSLPDAEDMLSEPFFSIAVRLADEGVPLRAIARGIKLPSDLVRQSLHYARDDGRLIQLPKDDWNPKERSDARARPPASDAGDAVDMVNNCVRFFKVTRLQACLLSALLRRHQCTKELLHSVANERQRVSSAEISDPKIVDVVVCHLRKRLKAFPIKIEIKTIWSVGYCIDAEQRRAALAALNAYVTGDVPNVETPSASIEHLVVPANDNSPPVAPPAQVALTNDNAVRAN